MFAVRQVPTEAVHKLCGQAYRYLNIFEWTYAGRAIVEDVKKEKIEGAIVEDVKKEKIEKKSYFGIYTQAISTVDPIELPEKEKELYARHVDADKTIRDFQVILYYLKKGKITISLVVDGTTVASLSFTTKTETKANIAIPVAYRIRECSWVYFRVDIETDTPEEFDLCFTATAFGTKR